MRLSVKRLPLAVAVLALAGLLPAQAPPSSAQADLAARLVAAALERPRHQVRYDGSYRRIPYPGGDVPADVGACTDEIIRIYRAVGIDLQKEVHQDMLAHFDAYPRRWGLARPDSNIDHRRVPNLMVFFARHGESLSVTSDEKDYRPGDLVTWDLGGGVPHIGMVVDRTTFLGNRHLVVHNIGEGPKMEDVLFAWKITGHYRYYGPQRLGNSSARASGSDR